MVGGVEGGWIGWVGFTLGIYMEFKKKKKLFLGVWLGVYWMWYMGVLLLGVLYGCRMGWMGGCRGS